MRIRYKPPYGEEASFDPGTEIICPLCGAVKPVPYGWRTHTTFVFCDRKEHHATRPEYYHNALFFDVNCFIDDDEPQLTAYRISVGTMYAEDVEEWLNKRTMWMIMWSSGGAPKWKIEPEPFWRHRIAKAIEADKKVPPPMPSPGPPEWIEKGFPRHENPNWWQKIENWLFAGKEEG